MDNTIGNLTLPEGPLRVDAAMCGMGTRRRKCLPVDSDDSSDLRNSLTLPRTKIHEHGAGHFSRVFHREGVADAGELNQSGPVADLLLEQPTVFRRGADVREALGD